MAIPGGKESQVSEKDVTLGEFLRNERELRGITIEQVASATKVGVRTLHALEADHYSELPARPYIRGFLTAYCRFIGLDPKEIRSRFDSYISMRALERPNREGGHSGYAFDKKDGDQQSRTVLLIAICSFIVVGGVAVIVLKPSLKHHRASHIDRLRAAQPNSAAVAGDGPSPMVQSSPSSIPLTAFGPEVQSPTSGVRIEGKTEKVASQDEKGSLALVGPSATPISSPSPSSSPSHPALADSNDPLDSGLSLASGEIQHKVIFKPTVDVWFRYQVDERPIRKFIVRKGKVLVLRAAHQILLQVSNPASVSFSYNGKGSSLVSSSKLTRTIHGSASLVFPSGNTGTDLFSNVFFSLDQALPKALGPVDSKSTQE